LQQFVPWGLVSQETSSEKPVLYPCDSTLPCTRHLPVKPILCMPAMPEDSWLLLPTLSYLVCDSGQATGLSVLQNHGGSPTNSHWFWIFQGSWGGGICYFFF
jgi:hypothetical protein